MKQEMITLLTKAFQRARERFVNFFWLLLLSGLPIFLAGLSVLFGMAYLTNLSQSWVIIFLAIPILLIFIVYYFWFNLAMVDVLIAENKQGVKETLVKVKPRLRGFIWYSLLYALFIIGLLPLGILTAAVILLLWSVWSVFAVFIYLEKNKKGLENLWVSRDMVAGRFWENVGKIVIIVGPVFILIIFIGLIHNDILTIVFQVFYGIFIFPFVLSFLYELYKTLPESHTAKPPKVWIILSLIGWVFVILFVIFVVPAILRSPNFTPCTDTETTRCLTS